TDALLDHADARRALAAALRAAGRSAEAAAEEQRAIELWDAKGATLLAERARRDIERGVHEERARDDRDRLARPGRRRLQPNAATASTAHLDAAIAARDADAIDGLIADHVEAVSHPGKWKVILDRQGWITSWRSLLHAQEPTCRHEPIATLGESLALCRRSVSGRGFAGAQFDVGPYEKEEIALTEVDTHGRQTRYDDFAEDRLGDAIARLYERYAELLPGGPEHTRAAATARSVAAVLGPFDPDGIAAAYAPDVEVVDHRILGTWSARGAGALQNFRAVLEVAD